jgi:hypothetical protein
MNEKIKKLKAEVEAIKKMNGGKFGPRDVVEYARKNKNTELHSRFEWDDRKAGEAYRVEQARGIIQSLKITVIERETEIVSIREYSSLTTDRQMDGSYRSTVQILSDEEMKAQLLDDIQMELVRINVKLRSLSIAAAKHIDRAVAVAQSEIKRLKPVQAAQARRG